MDSKDMIIEIISRTSLSTFDAMRCTSKEINKLTYDSKLMDLYMRRNNIISGLITQKAVGGGSPNYIKEFGPSPDSKSLDLSFLPNDAYIKASSEHGIIVFERPDLQFYVCKPATKQLVQLPRTKTKNETDMFSIVIMDSNPLRYKIFRFSRPRPPGVEWRCTYSCEVFDSSGCEMEWRLIDPIKLPYMTLLHKETITIGGSIYIPLTNYKIFKFDAYFEKWTSMFLQPKETLDFKIYPYWKLVKYEGKLGYAGKQISGHWVIWLLTSDESWVKTFVLNNTEKPDRLIAFYDSETCIMLNFFEALHYRFKGDDQSSNGIYMSTTRFSFLLLAHETFVLRSDLDVIDLVS